MWGRLFLLSSFENMTLQIKFPHSPMAFIKTFLLCLPEEFLMAWGTLHDCLSKDAVRKTVISKITGTKRCKRKNLKLKPESYNKNQYLHLLPSGEWPFLEKISRFDFIKGDVFPYTVNTTITKLFISVYITRCAANQWLRKFLEG